MSNPSLDQNDTRCKPTRERMLRDALARGDEHLLFTGRDARRISADLAELRELRRERAGGAVFKRTRSAYWQLKFRAGDRWVYESSGTTDKREALRLLAHKVYLASAVALPGTATFEQAIDLLLNDARVRGLRSLRRLERAGRALLARLEGLHAKDLARSALVNYAADRQQQGMASLREVVEETLTVLKLGLPAPLRGFLVTTNAIENLIGSTRRTSRNVTRWRSGDIISCWAAVGLLQAEEHFRRIRAYRHLPLLKRALRGDASKLDATEEAA